MNIESEYALSFYKDLTRLHDEHQVFVVQHIETRRLYVKKILTVFDLDVYYYLQKNPHTGIPIIHDIILSNDKLIIIEEYISGQSLKDILNIRIQLEEKEAIRLILSLCNILSYLHSAHPPIIHRDIKPENLIITDDQQLKLIDFNAAKQTRQTMTNHLPNRDTVLIGTAGYAAPEQYGFAASNQQTDIYAIGVLLNELLTGKLPTETIYPGRLGKIISKCISIDPSLRYKHIQDLQDALYGGFPVTTDKNSKLPPGFRTKTPWKMVLGVVGYILILYMTLTIDVETNLKSVLWLNRAAILFASLAIVYLWANYRDAQRYLPMTANRNRFIKLIGLIVISFLIIVFLISLVVLIESLLIG